MNEWISVEGRLPDEDSLIVAANFINYMYVPDVACCNFYNGQFCLNTDGISASNYDGGAVIVMEFKPTHWLPLPSLEVSI